MIKQSVLQAQRRRLGLRMRATVLVMRTACTSKGKPFDNLPCRQPVSGDAAAGMAEKNRGLASPVLQTAVEPNQAVFGCCLPM
jgi:hypothetical protein